MKNLVIHAMENFETVHLKTHLKMLNLAEIQKGSREDARMILEPNLFWNYIHMIVKTHYRADLEPDLKIEFEGLIRRFTGRLSKMSVNVNGTLKIITEI